MQLDSVAIELRPRNHWEALDLGCLLVRRWWRALYLSWLATALPVFLILMVFLHHRPLLAALVFWWLKPVYERAPLLILSRAIFGGEPDVRAALRELPHVVRVQMLQRLTIRRLSPSRAFDTPVDVLERLAGEPRRRRLMVLQRSAGAPAFWLTVIGVHVEVFLQLALLLIAVLLVPAQVNVDWWNVILADDVGALDWVSNAAYFVAATAVGPVYVASGFTLYLNRRMELEGWDIELRFRELARRVSGTAVLVLALAATLLVGLPQPALAEEPESRQASKTLIEDVLAGEAFHQQTVTRVPRFMRSWFEEDESEPGRQAMNLDWLRGLGDALALLAELALWVGAAVLAYYLIRWLAGYRMPWVPRAPTTGAHLRGVQTLDLDAPELQDDPFGTARGHWSAGRQREAVALLYRATLARLRDGFAVPIEPGDTEGDCLGKARPRVPAAVAELLARLTAVWLAAGYAHRMPGEADFLTLADRCEDVLRPAQALHV